ncbi:MAG: polysaccharide biosynthesis tyrosine autokinase [Clostridia bacterium]|nr:polysaccharide biosynthesis tyrosine autokinase [Clostridia bacterium]
MEEISIQDILQMLKKNLILLLVVAICGGMLGYFWTNFAVDPIYSASATIYVKSEDAGSQTATEIVMAQYLTNSYCYIVNESHEVHEKVLQGLITKYPQLTLKQIGAMVSSTVVDETEIFKITVTSTDRLMAVDVCNEFLKVMPDELIRIVKAGAVEIVFSAKDELVTVNHPVMRNAVLCAMIGFVITFVIIFIGKMMDNKIYTRDELSSNFQIPTLGVIPDNAVAGDKKRGARNAHSDIEDDRKRLLGDSTPFNVAEAYRMTRTNITYLPLGDGCKKLAVTSAFTAEGKTTACCNLAIALSQNGSKVLLIDADMRKPRVGRLLQVKAQYGLSECIAGICREIPVYKSSYQNLFVMTSGKSSENAAELLSSPRLESLVKACEDKFDYIIFDMPPLNLVTDAAIITKLVDGYIVAAFSGYSTVYGLKEAVASLEQVEGKILGFILAGVDPKAASYAGGAYHYKYGKYGKYGRYGRYAKYGNYGYYSSSSNNEAKDMENVKPAESANVETK